MATDVKTCAKLPIPCGDEWHWIAVCDDGSVEMLDHSEKTLRPFAAFEADAPRCLETLDRWRENPLLPFLRGGTDTRFLGLLACDYAEHVLPLLLTAKDKIDIDPCIRALRAARAYWNKRPYVLSDRCSLISNDLYTLHHRYDAAKAADAIAEAYKATRWSPGNPGKRLANARQAAQLAAKFAREARSESAAAYSHSRQRGGYKAEYDWQLCHTVRAWERLAAGKPKPRISSTRCDP